MKQGIVAKQLPSVPYKEGDFIGQKYEVYGILGMGGFGVVYLVYSHETKDVYALKTFQDEYLQDAETRDLFRKEANVWADLERHPYLVRAYFVDEVFRRLYIAMEFISPRLDDRQGLNSLEGYLKHRPPDLAQNLRWSIQFCHGMEYAYSKGLRCHRDIKPDNIMISQDKTIKITDFGLAGVLDVSRTISDKTMEGRGVGFPYYMPPEQFENAASCDESSDIYSFGTVMYQMAADGQLPFKPKNGTGLEWYRCHSKSPVPKLSSPLFLIIQQCLEKKPGRRYQTFKDLREDLERLLKHQTGEVIKPPEIDNKFEVWELGNKGVSLDKLGRNEEAICFHDRAIKLDPSNAKSWNNKGINLHKLSRFEDAICCYDKSIELNPMVAAVWDNKGSSLDKLGRYEEAIYFHDKAIKLDQSLAAAWNNKGNSLDKLGRCDEAINCYDKAIDLDVKYAEAWYNKGHSLHSLDRFEDAIRCYDKSNELNPMVAATWNNKGVILDKLGRFDEALNCYDKAIDLHVEYAEAWYNKGRSLHSLDCFEESIRSFNKAIKLDPKLGVAWNDKGNSLSKLGCFEEAIHCFDKAIEFAPSNARVLFNKGCILYILNRFEESIRCFNKAVELDPMYTQKISLLRK